MQREKRKTKIVATLGPASDTPETIGRLLQAGVDLFRLNFSHGDHAQKAQLIEHIRAASQRHGKQVGILADLQGPKIRTGKMSGDGMSLLISQGITANSPVGQYTATTRWPQDLDRAKRWLRFFEQLAKRDLYP